MGQDANGMLAACLPRVLQVDTGTQAEGERGALGAGAQWDPARFSV